MNGMCIRCGALKQEQDSEERSLALRYMHASLEVSAAEAERLRAETSAALLTARRLLLVVDLDHTLVNSAQYAELNQEEGRLLEGTMERQRRESGAEGDGAKEEGPEEKGEEKEEQEEQGEEEEEQGEKGEEDEEPGKV